MIEETAVVTRVENGLAWIETQRRSSCSACTISTGCGTSAIARMLGKRRAGMWVRDTQALQIGDVVVVGLEESSLVRGSLTVYAFPLFALFAAAGFGWLLFRWWGAAYTEIWQITFSLAGLAGGFAYLRRITRAWQQQQRFQPVVLRRLASVEQPVVLEAARRSP